MGWVHIMARLHCLYSRPFGDRDEEQPCPGAVREAVLVFDRQSRPRLRPRCAPNYEAST